MTVLSFAFASLSLLRLLERNFCAEKVKTYDFYDTYLSYDVWSIHYIDLANIFMTIIQEASNRPIA